MFKNLISLCAIFLIFSNPISLAVPAKKVKKAGSTNLFSDFDGTLIRMDGSWKSYYFLEKIENVHSTIQHTDEHKKSPSTMPVSIEEYEQMKYLLGQGSGRVNKKTRFELKPDIVYDRRPSYMIPGYYQINEHSTYKEFRHNDRTNFLVNDYLHAIIRKEKGNKKNFYGLAYETFAWLMANPSEGKIAIVTARGQNHKDFEKLFEHFKRGGDLKKFNSRFELYAAHAPESREWGRTLDEKKEAAIEIELQSVLNTPLNEEGEGFLHVNKDKALQGEREKKHLVIVAEDDSRLAYKLFKKTQHLSQENQYRNKIKFVFMHAGQDLLINQDPVFDGYRILVFDNGFTRPIVEEELKELHISLKAARSFNIKYIPSLKRKTPVLKNTNANKKTVKKQSNKKVSKCSGSF